MRSTAVIALLLVTTAEQAPEVRLKPEWGVVLPEDQSRAFWKPRLCNRPAPGPIEGIWIPDDATVLRLETVLAGALQRAIEQSNPARVKPTAADFYRQYAGFVVGGKRIVYINGFHASMVNRMPGGPTAWRLEALLPCDGGLLFFGAEFSVETGMVSTIVFNGGGRGRADQYPPPAGLRWPKVDLDEARVTGNEQLTKTGKEPAWGGRRKWARAPPNESFSSAPSELTRATREGCPHIGDLS